MAHSGPTTGDGEWLWEFPRCSLGRPFLPTSEWNLLQLAHNVSRAASTDAPSRTSDCGCQEQWLLRRAVVGSTTDATSVCAPTGRNFPCLDNEFVRSESRRVMSNWTLSAVATLGGVSSCCVIEKPSRRRHLPEPSVPPFRCTRYPTHRFS